METLTFDEIKQLFLETREQMKETREQMKETDKKFQESDRMLTEKFQETDKKFKESEKMLTEKFQETDRMIKELTKNISGISDSNGAMAENFFFTALENLMQLGKLKFDYIDRNLKRKRNNTEAEFDLIMYNSYKVVIVEVKYNFTVSQLREFYEKRIKKFRILFPEYKDYKLYGCIAGLVIDKKVKDEAENFGFIIITQNNDNIQIMNDKDFEATEFNL